MRVTGLVPAAATAELEGAELTAWLAARYSLPGESWLRLNLVTALGGQITGPSGTSNDLSGGIDRALLRVLRALSDVVLVGAASVRAEGYAMPRRAPLAVATAGGDLSSSAFPADLEPGRLLVLCPRGATERALATAGSRATIVPIDGDPLTDPGLLISALRDRGMRRITCEGGGGLASRLIAAGLVDEFDHSLAPVLTSPGAPLSVGTVPLTGARLAGLVLDETDRLYARWDLRRR
jgi:riboflavin biosynthesis pyrimidine reductase